MGDVVESQDEALKSQPKAEERPTFSVYGPEGRADRGLSRGAATELSQRIMLATDEEAVVNEDQEREVASANREDKDAIKTADDFPKAHGPEKSEAKSGSEAKASQATTSHASASKK